MRSASRLLSLVAALAALCGLSALGPQVVTSAPSVRAPPHLQPQLISEAMLRPMAGQGSSSGARCAGQNPIVLVPVAYSQI